MLNIPLLMGVPAGPEGSSPQSSFVSIGMIVAIFAVFWFLMIRPQRKKQKETKDMIAAIKKGDSITSIGGIRGVVKNVAANTVVVQVDNKGATLELTKSAIGSVDNVSREAAETPASSSGGEAGDEASNDSSGSD